MMCKSNKKSHDETRRNIKRDKERINEIYGQNVGVFLTKIRGIPVLTHDMERRWGY